MPSFKDLKRENQALRNRVVVLETLNDSLTELNSNLEVVNQQTPAEKTRYLVLLAILTILNFIVLAINAGSIIQWFINLWAN